MPNAPSSRSGVAGDAGVAGRAISRKWIGNVVFSSLLAAVCVGFTWHVMDWWGRPAWSPEEQRDEPLSFEGHISPPAALYGEPPFAHRQVTFRGDRAAAQAALRVLCQEQADQAIGVLSAQWMRLPPAGPAEMRLLNLVAAAPAVQQRDNEWVMHEHAGVFPLVLVVGLPFDREVPREEDRVESQFPALPRVITWGVAFAGCDTPSKDLDHAVQAAADPVGAGLPTASDPPAVAAEDGCWTLFACSRDAFGTMMSSMSIFPDLPPELDRDLIASLEGAICVCVVSGKGSADQWRKRFEEWFADREGALAYPWRDQGGAWQTQFIEPAMVIDINLADGPDGGVAGLLVIGVRVHDTEAGGADP